MARVQVQVQVQVQAEELELELVQEPALALVLAQAREQGWAVALVRRARSALLARGSACPKRRSCQAMA